MKIAGIIAEYNPFHSGHQYHIEETRRRTGADYVIVVMSGDYVQRGEPAIADKYLRTQMALKGGADVVIEMPVCYATASAEYFATAGVGILESLGCVDYLSFGSEWASSEEMMRLANLLIEEPDAYKKQLKAALSSGMNYPKAREHAIRFCYPEENLAEILKTPNHILGIEYIKALKRRNSSIEPFVIERKGASYHEQSLQTEEDMHPSASSLRNYLLNSHENIDKHENIEKHLNVEKHQMIQEEIYHLGQALPHDRQLLIQRIFDGDLVTWADLMPYLDYRMLMHSKSDSLCFGQDEEMFHRIRNHYVYGRRMEEIIELCHSKNYTDVTIRRFLLHFLLHLPDTDYLHDAADIPIPYARILGFRKESSKLLAMMREKSTIPIIQKLAAANSLLYEDAIAYEIFSMDIRASQLYEHISSQKAGRKMVQEMTRNQVII